MPAKGRTTKRVQPKLPGTPRPARLPDDDLSDDALLSGLEFDGIDLGARTARLIDIEGCRLTGTTLAESRLDKLTVVDSVLDHCDIANVSLDHSSMTRVELIGCRATGLVVPNLLVRHLLVRECLLDMSSFRFATLTNAVFVDCRMTRADFVSADLTSAIFRRCDLTGVELSQVKARGALFVDCNWDGVRGLPSLNGATVVHGSPIDEHAFMAGMAANLGIRLGDPADFAAAD